MHTLGKVVSMARGLRAINALRAVRKLGVARRRHAVSVQRTGSSLEEHVRCREGYVSLTSRPEGVAACCSTSATYLIIRELDRAATTTSMYT
jgi:hypothetical protein